MKYKFSTPFKLQLLTGGSLIKSLAKRDESSLIWLIWERLQYLESMTQIQSRSSSILARSLRFLDSLSENRERILDTRESEKANLLKITTWIK